MVFLVLLAAVTHPWSLAVPAARLAGFYIALVATATIFTLLADGATLSIARLSGTSIGPIMLLGIIALRTTGQDLQDGLFRGILLAAPLMSLISLGQVLNVRWILEFSAAAYTSPVRRPFFNLQTDDGLSRAVSTLESPAATGAYMSIVVFVALTYLLQNRNFAVSALGLTAAIVGGLASSSVTFLLGAPSAVLFALVARARISFLKAAISFVFVAISSYVSFVLLQGVLDQQDSAWTSLARQTNLPYQVRRVRAGSFTGGRFDTLVPGGANSIVSTREVLLGRGATEMDMVGESIAASLISYFGLLGILALAVVFLVQNRLNRSRPFVERDYAGYLMFVLGFGIGVLGAPRLGTIAWLCVPLSIETIMRAPHRRIMNRYHAT